ncbi:MAG: lysophospholipid acyltransferase family protein [Alphaproteobacteria bacterium]|nr:lysophospholipid acyltransferase family protein [Alphaproteobacteria bacterium]
MTMIKTWLKSPQGIAAVARLASMVLGMLLKTIRWTTIDKGGLELVQSGEAVIFVNWHCRLLSIPAMIGHRYPAAYIISPSRDGQLISGTVAPLGVGTIWGSRSSKAISGYREMRRRLNAGLHVGITPDGPRGPARMAAAGAIMLAKSSGAALVPVSWSTSRIKRLNSWDRLAVPKAFSRGVQYYGAPIRIPRDADDAAVEAARLALEDAINHVSAEADAIFGHAPDHAASRYGEGKEKR